MLICSALGRLPCFFIEMIWICVCLFPLPFLLIWNFGSLSVGHYELCRDDIGGFTWKPQSSLA